MRFWGVTFYIKRSDLSPVFLGHENCRKATSFVLKIMSDHSDGPGDLGEQHGNWQLTVPYACQPKFGIIRGCKNKYGPLKQIPHTEVLCVGKVTRRALSNANEESGDHQYLIMTDSTSNDASEAKFDFSNGDRGLNV